MAVKKKATLEKEEAFFLQAFYACDMRQCDTIKDYILKKQICQLLQGLKKGGDEKNIIFIRTARKKFDLTKYTIK